MPVRGPEWPQPIGFEWNDHEIEVECEVCGERRAFRIGDQERWHDLSHEAREHWEAHAGTQYPVTFFALPALGDRKQDQTGTWADVVRSIPYLVGTGQPVPPFAVLRVLLRRGTADAGMSGGCEWPRHELTEREYEGLRAELVAQGCVDVEVPASVLTESAYWEWKIGYSGSAGGSSSSM